MGALASQSIGRRKPCVRDCNKSAKRPAWEKAMVKTIVRLAKDESGATAIEYGLIATAGGLAIAGAMPGLNSHIANAWNSIVGAVTTAASS